MLALLFKHRTATVIFIIIFLSNGFNSYCQRIATLTETVSVDSLVKKADFYLKQDSDSALYYATKADRMAKQYHYAAGATNALIKLAIYYGNKGRYAEAMENILNAIQLCGNNNNNLKARAYLELAQVYKDMSSDKTKDYTDKGLENSRIAYAIYRNVKDTSGMENSLSELGILFRDKAKMINPSYYDSALQVFTDAIRLARLTRRDDGTLAKLYNNISQVYIEYKKDYQTGLAYLFKAETENKRINSVWGLSHNYANISDTYLELKDNEKGLLYARKSLEASKQVNRPSRVYFSYMTVYAAFKAMHQYDSALNYFVLATTLNDSLLNISRTEQVLDLQYKYETAKKELEIRDLNQESAEKSNRILILITILIVTAAVAIGFIWLYRRVQKQKVTLDLQSKKLEAMMLEITSQKNELEEVGKVKDKLFSVISHDLKTPVNTLISFADILESSEVKPEKLKSYMAVLKGTLSKTSSLMSNLLHWAASQMHGFKPVIINTNVKEVVERVLLDADQQIQQKQVIVYNEIPGYISVAADPDMLAVILRNLIANAVKYVRVKTGEIRVSINAHNGMIGISVKDNGIGLQQDEVEAFNNTAVITTSKSQVGTQKEKGTGLGLMLCKTLAKQMNGRISAANCSNAGAEFSVYIPAA